MTIKDIPYLKALIYSRDIPGISSDAKTYQLGQDSRCVRDNLTLFLLKNKTAGAFRPFY